MSGVFGISSQKMWDLQNFTGFFQGFQGFIHNVTEGQIREPTFKKMTMIQIVVMFVVSWDMYKYIYIYIVIYICIASLRKKSVLNII